MRALSGCVGVNCHDDDDDDNDGGEARAGWYGHVCG